MASDAKGQKTGAHTEADGGHGGGFPPFESSTFASQLVSLVIAFVALYIIVSRFALPKVGGYGLEMMFRTCTVQGNFDFSGKLRSMAIASVGKIGEYSPEVHSALRLQLKGAFHIDAINSLALVGAKSESLLARFVRPLACIKATIIPSLVRRQVAWQTAAPRSRRSGGMI